MNGFAVLQRYDSESAPSQFWNDAPMAYPAIGLGLTPQRLCQDPFAPRPLDVRTLAKHLLFEVSRGLHEHEDYREVHRKKQTGAQPVPPVKKPEPATGWTR
jgi:hypothetical protein